MTGEAGGFTTGRTAADNPSRIRVALLGFGDFSHELVLALQRLGAEVIVLGRGIEAPIADRLVVVDLADADELAAALRWLQPHRVVVAADTVSDAALADRAGVEVVPTVRAAQLTADPEALRRLAADELGLPTPPFFSAGSVEELRAVAHRAGFPMVVKPAVGGLADGRSVMVRDSDIEPAWQRAMSASSAARVVAEMPVEFDGEVTVLAGCRRDGAGGPAVNLCAPIGRRSVEHANGQLSVEVWQPYPMSAVALESATSIAARLAAVLGGCGMFGVDLLVHGDDVMFTGATLRPDEAALLTMRTQRLSFFELQARLILGLAFDGLLVSPGAARLIYARRAAHPDSDVVDPDSRSVLAEALSVPESDVLIFRGDADRPRQRLGMAVATGPDVTVARNRAEQVAAQLGRLWP